MTPRSLLIGNSDGIGLAITQKLLADGWEVLGISKSESPVASDRYRHLVMDVRDGRYPESIAGLLLTGPLDLCIYCAGIGERLDISDMSGEAGIIEVNLTGMIRTVAAVIPGMVKRGQGHFIGLSSVADELISPKAPSYHASKAGFTNYLEGLARAVRPEGVHVTNVRFGFVDTKMAKGKIRPFMMSIEKAVSHLEICMRKKPVCYTAPKTLIPLLKLRKLMMRLGAA